MISDNSDINNDDYNVRFPINLEQSKQRPRMSKRYYKTYGLKYEKI